MTRINLDFIVKAFRDAGLLLLSFILFSLFFSNVFYLLKINFSVLFFWIPLLTLLFVYFVMYNKKESELKQYTLKISSAFIFLICVGLSMFVGTRIYDVSYDGNYYHKAAIGLLKNGWNPIYERAEDKAGYFAEINPNNKIFTWINHYQNASWIFGASLYKMTGNIETAKGFNYMILMASFLILFYALSRILSQKKRFWLTLLMSILTVLSPTVLAQIFSFYIDGSLYLLLSITILTLSIITIELSKNSSVSVFNFLIFITSVILMINLKLSGLLLVATTSLPFMILWIKEIFFKKDLSNNSNIKKFYKLLGCAVGILIISFLTISASSYLKNLRTKGNPFYPLIGSNKVDIITTMQPMSFSEKNQIEKFINSVFSKSENVSHSLGHEPKFKIPFSWDEDEVNELYITDTRIGGFGILYSAIFIITIVSAVMILIHLDKHALTTHVFLCIIAGSLLYLILPTENWWARYAPNIYLLTPTTAVMLLYARQKNKSTINNKILLVVFMFLITITSINLIPFISNRLLNFEVSREIKLELLKLAHEDNSKNDFLIIEDFYGITFNLIDSKIITPGSQKIPEILGRPASRDVILKYPYTLYNGRILYINHTMKNIN